MAAVVPPLSRPVQNHWSRSLRSRRAAARSSDTVIYARVSSKEQEREGFSIPAQIRLLKSYAAANGFRVAREIVDIETAKQAGRIGFSEMVAFLRKNRSCRVVLVEKTDRLYRNLRDWVVLDELDLEIHFVKEGFVLSEDSRSSEKLIHGIKVLMAKNYIDNLSEETRKGMLEKAEQGIWPSYAPLGYRNIITPDGKKIIEPDPDIAPAVVRMFERYATASYSGREIARLAVADGLVFRKSRTPMPQATVYKILRNRIYTGDFDWNGRTYRGTQVPLITKELWLHVQTILNRRFANKHRKVKHDFAFSGLISCGHCGCSLVGEIKKRRYVYYHCTGWKGRCPEPYTREEALEEQFTDLLRGLTFDQEVLDWVAEALRESHADERRYHDEAITRLQAEYQRLQGRLDGMYVDKLDGRVMPEFFERKAAEWRADQDRILRAVDGHQSANRTYLDEGVRLLDLARRAHELFRRQEAPEKRRLLNFVVSNCTWSNGRLTATYRQPFDMLAVSASAWEAEKAAAGAAASISEKWLPGLVSNQRLPD
jgi:site-specific DNA recombinase